MPAPSRRAPRSCSTSSRPAERLALLHQHAAPVPRLGLGPFRTGTEGLHGVAWLGTATTFPQPVGLAATWDADLLERVGTVVGTEVRAKHAADPTVSLNVWAPVVNPLRHPRWGRNEEGFSEDPHLTAHLATAYARGLRGDHPTYWRTVPTLKHLVAYGNETDRSVTSAQLSPRVLHEYELPAFRGPIEAGVVGAVMPSYNLVNGRPNHVARELLDEVRGWTPASLLVVSDAGAPTNLVGRRALLRRPRRGRRRRGPGRRGLVHRPRRRPDPHDRAPDRRPGARAARPGGRRPRRAAPARAAPGDRRAGPRRSTRGRR